MRLLRGVASCICAGVSAADSSSGRMPEQVRAMFHDIVREHGGLDAEQAERYVRSLEIERRWQEECW